MRNASVLVRDSSVLVRDACTSVLVRDAYTSVLVRGACTSVLVRDASMCLASMCLTSMCLTVRCFSHTTATTLRHDCNGGPNWRGQQEGVVCHQTDPIQSCPHSRAPLPTL